MGAFFIQVGALSALCGMLFLVKYKDVGYFGVYSMGIASFQKMVCDVLVGSRQLMLFLIFTDGTSCAVNT